MTRAIAASLIPTRDAHILPPRSYARVAINRPVTQAYTYFVPESMSADLRVGSLVEVPLRTETVAGVVVDLIDTADIPANRIKPIARQLTPEYFIDAKLMKLGEWIAQYYFCALGEALAAVSMIGLNHVTTRQVTTYTLAHAAELAEQIAARKQNEEEEPAAVKLPNGRAATAQQIRVIEELLEQPHLKMTAQDLREQTGVSAAVVATLEKRGVLVREEVEAWNEEETREENRIAAAELMQPHTLTPVQEGVFFALKGDLERAEYHAALLQGVTGSGKTEIYLRVIAEALKLGRTAIVLVPEIALTPQVVEAFRARLGGIAAVYHSKLKLSEKFELWKRIQSNEIRVVIGARSALFAALPSLGVIIVDEEHETSYKQGEAPRYHGRDAAVMRARQAGALVVLGSATPSVESLHNSREGKYTLLRLPERIGPHAPPKIALIDMRKHLPKPGQKEGEHLISPPLRGAIEQRLERGEQAVMLLNRRGYASHVLCLKCETSLICPHCEIAMTYHKRANRLMCHWCGERQPLPQVCPTCGEGEIHTLGLGTERVEEILREMFPKARMLRVDADTMSRRGAFEDAWRRISAGEVDLILGTQMIAKGLHLERVTLAAVVSADFALFMPDFRAGERTWALLTQVAGRAGRGEIAGEVMVQTYAPHHYAIELAARGDANAFYERELHFRHVLQFPPFGKLAAIIVSGPEQANVRGQAEQLYNLMRPFTFRPEFKSVKVFAATPAPIGKLNDQFRWRLLARSTHVKPLHEVLKLGLQEAAKVKMKSGVNVVIDIDPIDLL